MNKALIMALMAGTHVHKFQNGACVACGATCPGHDWSGDVCRVCGLKCAHTEVVYYDNNTHTCTQCGTATEHTYPDEFIGTADSCTSCEACAHILTHTFSDCVCTRCRYECTHGAGFVAVDGSEHLCPICGATKAHTVSTYKYTDNVCAVCDICGGNVSHIYADGACVNCGHSCTHTAAEQLVDNDQQHLCSCCGQLQNHTLVPVSDETVLEMVCSSCSVCGYRVPHKYEQSICTVCGHECNHRMRSDGAETHSCELCDLSETHVFEPSEDERFCHCYICDYDIKHKLKGVDASSCVNCDRCGLERADHSFNKKTVNYSSCGYCGYMCYHPWSEWGAVGSTQCGVCGYEFNIDGSMVVYGTGDYAGQYTYEDTINGVPCYKRVKSPHSDTELFVVALNITTPRMFGGSYAYTATGYAFTADPPNLPINQILLTGSGKLSINLAQYSVSYDSDGNPIFSDEPIAKGSYTSDDCKNLNYILP